MVTTTRRTVRGYPIPNGGGPKGFQTRSPYAPRPDAPVPGSIPNPRTFPSPVPPPWKDPFPRRGRPDRPERKPPPKNPVKPQPRDERKWWRKEHFPTKGTEPLRRKPLPLGFGRARKGVYEMPRYPFGNPWDLGRKVLPLLPMFNPDSPTIVTLPSGWTWCKGPVDPPLPVCDPPTNWATKPWMVPGTCLLNVPLYGQGGTVLPDVPDATDFIWPFDNEYYAQRAYVDCIGTTTHTVVFGVAQRLSGTEVPFTDPGTVYSPREVAPDRYGYGWPDTFGWPTVPRLAQYPTPYARIPEIQPSELGPISERTERGYDIEVGIGAHLGDSPSSEPEPGPTRLPPGVKPHRPAPPGARTKERKLRVQGALKAVYAFAQWLTEAQDGFQAAYYAIPKSIRGHEKRTPLEIDAFVYRHWGDVDLEKFLRNILNNEFQDFIYGGLGQARGKALRRLGVLPYTSWDTSGVPAYSRQGAGFEPDLAKFTDLCLS